MDSNPRPITDLEVVHAYRNGESWASDELGKRLLAIFPSIRKANTNSRHRQTTRELEDIVGEAFLIALEQIDRGKYTGKASLQNWMHGIYRKCLLQRILKKFRKREVQDDGTLSMVQDREVNVRERLMALVEATLVKLSEWEQQLVQWFLDGLSIKEIAVRLQLSESHTRTRLKQIIDTIRRELGDR
ncbi:MAG: sigma-70 family RNA polymerase sigma factor [Planctomycetota bacterium]